MTDDGVEDLDGNVQLDDEFQVEVAEVEALKFEDEGGKDDGVQDDDDDFATFQSANRASDDDENRGAKKGMGKRRGSEETMGQKKKGTSPKKRRRLQKLSSRRKEYRKEIGERERHPLGRIFLFQMPLLSIISQERRSVVRVHWISVKICTTSMSKA